MASSRGFSHRLREVGMENLENSLEPICGLWSVSPMPLTNATEPLVRDVPGIQEHVGRALSFASGSSVPYGVSKDGVAAVNLLTQDWPRHEDSLYSIINTRLRDSDRCRLKEFLPVLKHLLLTLSKWPIADPPMWRGVDRDMSSQFHVGKTVLWWGFGSGTTDRSSLDNPAILGKNTKRTLFKVETVKGHLVGNFTDRKEQTEVLLAPGLFFEVTEVIKEDDGLTTTVVLKDTMPSMKAMDFPI